MLWTRDSGGGTREVEEQVRSRVLELSSGGLPGALSDGEGQTFCRKIPLPTHVNLLEEWLSVE